jgi:hypothetical protein
MLAPFLWGLLLAPPLVSSVQLLAPHSERYTATLGLPAGAPYDPEAVRAAVLRLFATGDFEDVAVEVASGEGGTALVFRTRAAAIPPRGGARRGLSPTVSFAPPAATGAALAGTPGPRDPVSRRTCARTAG